MPTRDTRQLHGFGLHLVQLKPGGKAPAGGDGWRGRVAAPGAPFDPPADANIGAMGGCPLRPGHNLLVLDIDVKNGAAGPASLARAQADHGAIPRTARVTTPSGGEHYYLAVPDDIPLGDVFSVFARLGYPGIDCIGAGRFVAAPPSVLADGGAYEWLCRPDEAGVAAAPPWLLSWLRLAGRPDAPPKRRAAKEKQKKALRAAPGATPPAAKAPADHAFLLADVVRRYPVGSENGRNSQMSKAVASLTTKRVPDPVVRELMAEWLEHFAGAYTTPFDTCLVELERCQESLRRKIESGRFEISSVNHAVDQSNLVLAPTQEAFLAALAPSCPFLTIVEKDKEAADRGGWDENEEAVAPARPPRPRRLTPGEKRLAECLVRLVAYKLERGEVEGDEFLATNEQMMDLMAARFGAVFKSSANEFGSKQFRRLKQALITKPWKGRVNAAEKVELAVVVSEGCLGTPSRYRMTKLAEAFRWPAQESQKEVEGPNDAGPAEGQPGVHGEGGGDEGASAEVAVGARPVLPVVVLRGAAGVGAVGGRGHGGGTGDRGGDAGPESEARTEGGTEAEVGEGSAPISQMTFSFRHGMCAGTLGFPAFPTIPCRNDRGTQWVTAEMTHSAWISTARSSWSSTVRR